MKYIPEAKIDLYLNRDKKLALFVGVGEYFESKTFDWLRLEKNGDYYKAVLVRSFDEGDEVFTEVLGFATVNELDEAEGRSFEGAREEVLQWIKDSFQVQWDKLCLTGGLSEKYIELVKSGKLGRQRDDDHV